MQTTDLWLTPLILLPGVALLIVSTAARFSALQDEFHFLMEHSERRAQITARGLVRRARFYRNALVCLYSAVALFSVGSLVGGVLNVWLPEHLWLVAALTILGIGAVVVGAAYLLRESLLSMQVVEELSAEVDRTG